MPHHTPSCSTPSELLPHSATSPLFGAEAMLIIEQLLCQGARDKIAGAVITLGVMRFSLLRFHQRLLSSLSQAGASVLVCGEVDAPAQPLTGVEYIELAAESPLLREWFMIVQSPCFGGALLGRATVSEAGQSRHVAFRAALTGDLVQVQRAALLTCLLLRRSCAPLVVTDEAQSQARWTTLQRRLGEHERAAQLQLADLPIEQPAPAEKTSGALASALQSEPASPRAQSPEATEPPSAIIAGISDSATDQVERTTQRLTMAGYRVNCMGAGVPLDHVIATAHALKPQRLVLVHNHDAQADIDANAPSLDELGRTIGLVEWVTY